VIVRVLAVLSSIAWIAMIVFCLWGLVRSVGAWLKGERW
jgi:hypothetical protein